jgi:thiol-disulfide isomerase/thioredoxin
MIKKIILIVFSFLLASGCDTNPPNTWTVTEEFGQVIVTSNVDDAEIIIDNISSGYFTPDTLRLKIGSYSIKLSKYGYISNSEDVEIIKDHTQKIEVNLIEQNLQKIVMLEDFSNVSCGPCVASNKILKSLKNSYTHKKIIVIKYPTNFPSPVDPMHLESPGDSKTRMAYYNILFTPTIIVDGVNKPIASDSNSIKSQIDENLLLSPKFEIIATDSIVGNILQISGTLKLLDETELDFNNLVLHTVLIESKIEYSTPPGSNGETEFEDVMRKMIPTTNGFSISSIENVESMDFKWDVEIKTTWNKDKLRTIIFIQDSKSGKIYQASLLNKD